jgi:hypothetical protein
MILIDWDDASLKNLVCLQNIIQKVKKSNMVLQITDIQLICLSKLCSLLGSANHMMRKESNCTRLNTGKDYGLP